MLRCSPLQLNQPEAPLLRCRLDGLLPGLRGTPEEAAQLLSRLHNEGSCSVTELLAGFPAERHPFLRMSLVWLAKMGRIDWRPSLP